MRCVECYPLGDYMEQVLRHLVYMEKCQRSDNTIFWLDDLHGGKGKFFVDQILEEFPRTDHWASCELQFANYQDIMTGV